MCLFFDSKAGGKRGGSLPVRIMLSDAGRMLDATLSIEALGMAVKKMRVGEHAQVLATSKYAFGAEGSSNGSSAGWVPAARVPANATVALDIELLRFGEQDVVRDGLGSLLVTYLREWPSLTDATGLSLAFADGVAHSGDGEKRRGGWRRVRRGSGWRTAFSGGHVRRVEVVLRFVARATTLALALLTLLQSLLPLSFTLTLALWWCSGSWHETSRGVSSIGADRPPAPAARAI